MDLLDSIQRQAIRAALQDVIDTFHKIPILIFKREVDSSDDFMEDLSPRFNEYETVGYIEYEGNEVETDETGTYDKSNIKVTFGHDNLDDVGLIEGNLLPAIEPELDYMIIENREYRITSVVTEGHFEPSSILVVVKGYLREKTS